MEDQSRMRVSDADRHQVADLLRDAAAEGRLDWEELEQRLEAAYAARTYADLLPITDDLPSARTPVVRPTSAPVPGPLPPTGEVQRAFAVMGGVDRRGAWTVPERMTVLALMGGAHLDLRQASFAAPEVVLTLNAVMGGIEVLVGPDTEVVVEGIGIMGGFAGPSGLVAGDAAPTRRVRVRGVAFWGGVSVERKHVPELPA
jgi:hypothetical protein